MLENAARNPLYDRISHREKEYEMKTYISPEMEIICLPATDIIVTSYHSQPEVPVIGSDDGEDGDL